ncbi:flagellar filament capping protein FliD [Thermomonas alba]|uniref:flagellar filament capping protein FliD n=1 Tax=Thermomonas alba TaxID=2888525 RepID=UPI001F03E4EC|nr:flagellar filament capping protein FliD [Thermomonas alba]
MATITSAGIGSGLDVVGLVSQLVAAERAPADKRLTTAETSVKAQLSAFGQLKSALSGLESALSKLTGNGALPGRKATPQDGAGFTASASSSAVLGTYSISVEQLASAHKLRSAFAASNTQIGYGTLTFQVGSGTPFDVTIDSGKGTLADIRDAINSQAGGKVLATLVRGDSGDALVLTSGTQGSAGALTISASGGNGGLAVLATSGGTLTQVAAAQDAQVVVDGVTRTSSSNTLTDLIDGVSLTLTKANPGQPYSLKVESDASTLKASVLGFVSAYNAALSTIRTQSAAGGDGKTAGPLSGDATARSMMQSLRSAVGNHYAELNAIGLSTAVDGSLSLDGSKFDAAISGNPQAVKNLLGDDAAFGKAMRDILHNFNGAQGLLDVRNQDLNKRLKSISDQRATLDDRMARLEASYRQQFAALDALMAQMQGTSTYIANQLGAANKA